MGERAHLVRDGKCTVCGVDTILRGGRERCPIAWRAGHYGGRNKGRRKEHVLTASRGHVKCSCGAPAVLQSNEMWGCSTQQAQANRGMERQKRFLEREGEYVWNDPRVQLTDADFGMTSTLSTREYKTLSGRTKGGAPPETPRTARRRAAMKEFAEPVEQPQPASTLVAGPPPNWRPTVVEDLRSRTVGKKPIPGLPPSKW